MAFSIAGNWLVVRYLRPQERKREKQELAPDELFRLRTEFDVWRNTFAAQNEKLSQLNGDVVGLREAMIKVKMILNGQGWKIELPKPKES